jgi:hypothetical protein
VGSAPRPAAAPAPPRRAPPARPRLLTVEFDRFVEVSGHTRQRRPCACPARPPGQPAGGRAGLHGSGRHRTRRGFPDVHSDGHRRWRHADCRHRPRLGQRLAGQDPPNEGTRLSACNAGIALLGFGIAGAGAGASQALLVADLYRERLAAMPGGHAELNPGFLARYVLANGIGLATRAPGKGPAPRIRSGAPTRWRPTASMPAAGVGIGHGLRR